LELWKPWLRERRADFQEDAAEKAIAIAIAIARARASSVFLLCSPFLESLCFVGKCVKL
jgi:hypothetical protein